MDPETDEILHYAEKPETYVSRSINGGAYCFSKEFFDLLDTVSQEKKRSKLDFDPEHLQLEQEVIGPRCGSGKFFGKSHFQKNLEEPKFGREPVTKILITISTKNFKIKNLHIQIS